MRKKRLLSALMVLAMAISLVPVQVLAAFDDGSWGYYFYNTTDGSLSKEVQVYYSTDGETLTPLAHGDTAFVSSSDIQWDRVNAIVFYVSITEDAEDAGVTFTTNNQEGTLNTISKNGTQATISGTTNNTIGRTNFTTATNSAYDRYECRYAFFYSQFDWSEHGGRNHFRGFQVWLDMPEERYSIAYHSNIPGEDTVQYQTLNTTAGSTTLWGDEVYVRDGYTLTGWNSQADGNGTSYQLEQVVHRNDFTFSNEDDTQVTHLYAMWTKDSDAGWLDIRVYVDGVLQTLTDESDLKTYLETLTYTGETTAFSYTIQEGNIHGTYDYTTYNAADLSLTVADGYVLQGVYGTFIFGETGCKGLSVDGSTYGIDNVKGGTTLSIYLNTTYSIAYEIEEGGNPPTDTNTYITDKALNENTAEPDFSGVSENSPQADRTEGKEGGWTTSGLQTALTLQNIPDGYTGWYDESNVQHASGTAIDLSAEDLSLLDPDDDHVITFHATKNAPALTVEKSLYTVTRDGEAVEGIQDEGFQVQVGDILTYQVTVTNSGNVTLSDIAVSDTLGEQSLSLYDNEGCSGTPVTSISALSPGEGETLYACYTVETADAGKTLTNSAVAQSGGTTGTGSTETTVKHQYTLAVNYYYDAQEEGSLFASTEYTLNEGDPWSVVVGETQEDCTHHAPQEIERQMEEETVHYAFDPVATTDSLEGSGIQEDVTVHLVYSVDEIGNEEDPNQPDGVPDQYQVTIEYVSEDTAKGTVGALTREVKTILQNGEWAAAGTITTTGSTATAQEGYFFQEWTVKNGSADAVPVEGEDETLAPMDLSVTGGTTVTFTAYFTEKSYAFSVEKTLTSVGETEIPTAPEDIPMAEIGEDIVWTITVTNTGNQTLTDLVLTDTIGGEPTGTVTLSTAESGVEIDGTTATIASLEAGATVKITATYTVQEADAGKTLNNTAVVTGSEGTGDEDTPEESVTVSHPGLEVTKSADETSAGLGDTITYTITVENTGNTELRDVVVTDPLMTGTVSIRMGDGSETTIENVNGSYTIPTLEKDTSAAITYQYTVTEENMERGELVNSVTTQAGENGPEDTDSVTVLTGTITITPADITVYTGGNGYTGVVTDESGSVVGENTEQGLPEPGYYITLPDTVNAKIQSYLEEQGESIQQDESGYVDLSDILRFSYNLGGETRAWALQLYSQDGNSEGNSGVFAENRYIYRLVTVEGESPVRLQFSEYAEDGSIQEDSYISSDAFVVDLDTLYKTYAMTIYPGALQQDAVQATLQLGDGENAETYTFDISIAPGTLTIRGTTANAVTELVGSDTSDSGFAAAVPSGTYYTINDSQVQVDQEDAIALLVDDLVTEGDDTAGEVLAALEEATSNALEEAGIAVNNPAYEMKYMDLVDTNNGNVYVTAKSEDGQDATVTVTWPMPTDADENGTFYVVHFKDLDREFEGSEAVSNIENAETEVIQAEVTEGGIQFSTSSFSPFVLVYRQGEADLTVEKVLTQVNGEDYAGGSVSVGDELTYTVTVTNSGTLDLLDVLVSDTMSNGQTVTWVDLPEGVTQGEDGTLTIASLPADSDPVTLTAVYTVQSSDADSSLSNTVNVTGQTHDGGTTEKETTTPETPVNPTEPSVPPETETPDEPELNTEDHYAYIVGYEDGSVQPEGDITRAEVATIFFRLLTDESRNEFWSQTNDYTDVPADAWYNNAVSTLTNAGIIDGYEDGTFKPDGSITRAEFATIAVRFFEATYDGEDLFSDIAGHWAQDYINEAANAGIVNGYEDGTFRPQQYITRAEAVTMVNRTIDRHPDADHLLDDMITWPDNLETAWYYEQVQEATNSHEYTMNTDDEQNPYEIWTELLPNRDWSELEKAWSDANDGAGSGEVV